MDLLQLESIVTTKLRIKVPKLTDNKYPNMTFSNDLSDKVAMFPNVYIHELEPSEVGNSIPNQTIHALRDTFQIEVSTNVSKADARTVINACIMAMKSLRYSLVTGPTYIRDNNIHRYVIRMRRVIANGDEF